MNYLEAKSVLLPDPPRIPFGLVAFEMVALVGLAAILVKLFA